MARRLSALVAVEQLFLFQLAHLVSGQLRDSLQLLGHLVRREALLAPVSQLRDRQAAAQHAHRGDLLAPRRVGLPDDRHFRDELVLQQHGLDLQGGDLVAPGLDDVHGGAAHDAVDGGQLRRRLRGRVRLRPPRRRLHGEGVVERRPQLLRRASELAIVPCAEPAVGGELLGGGLGELVVLLEDRGAADEDAPVVVALDLDLRQGPADASGVAGALDVVAQAHADLRHAIPL
mmetsp:Transcript_52392/g.145157  ORF Transcript_52392/g.145157 Transcript_52392/m.145157 type:complete len:232 (+) Transcript_52392:107-802(+)